MSCNKQPSIERTLSSLLKRRVVVQSKETRHVSTKGKGWLTIQRGVVAGLFRVTFPVALNDEALRSTDVQWGNSRQQRRGLAALLLLNIYIILYSCKNAKLLSCHCLARSYLYLKPSLEATCIRVVSRVYQEQRERGGDGDGREKKVKKVKRKEQFIIKPAEFITATVTCKVKKTTTLASS